MKGWPAIPLYVELAALRLKSTLTLDLILALPLPFQELFSSGASHGPPQGLNMFQGLPQGAVQPQGGMQPQGATPGAHYPHLQGNSHTESTPAAYGNGGQVAYRGMHQAPGTPAAYGGIVYPEMGQREAYGGPRGQIPGAYPPVTVSLCNRVTTVCNRVTTVCNRVTM